MTLYFKVFLFGAGSEVSDTRPSRNWPAFDCLDLYNEICYYMKTLESKLWGEGWLNPAVQNGVKPKWTTCSTASCTAVIRSPVMAAPAPAAARTAAGASIG